METLIIVLHVLACLVLIISVLLQSGHEGMGVIFGGGSSSMFGSTGAGGLLVKVTAGVAALFLVTSLTYNVISGNRVVVQKSVMDGAAVESTEQPVEQPKPGVQFKDTEQEAPAESQ